MSEPLKLNSTFSVNVTNLYHSKTLNLFNIVSNIVFRSVFTIVLNYLTLVTAQHI